MRRNDKFVILFFAAVAHSKIWAGAIRLCPRKRLFTAWEVSGGIIISLGESPVQSQSSEMGTPCSTRVPRRRRSYGRKRRQRQASEIRMSGNADHRFLGVVLLVGKNV